MLEHIQALPTHEALERVRALVYTYRDDDVWERLDAFAVSCLMRHPDPVVAAYAAAHWHKESALGKLRSRLFKEYQKRCVLGLAEIYSGKGATQAYCLPAHPPKWLAAFLMGEPAPANDYDIDAVTGALYCSPLLASIFANDAKIRLLDWMIQALSDALACTPSRVLPTLLPWTDPAAQRREKVLVPRYRRLLESAVLAAPTVGGMNVIQADHPGKHDAVWLTLQVAQEEATRARPDTPHQGPIRVLDVLNLRLPQGIQVDSHTVFHVRERMYCYGTHIRHFPPSAGGRGYRCPEDTPVEHYAAEYVACSYTLLGPLAVKDDGATLYVPGGYIGACPVFVTTSLNEMIDHIFETLNALEVC